MGIHFITCQTLGSERFSYLLYLNMYVYSCNVFSVPNQETSISCLMSSFSHETYRGNETNLPAIEQVVERLPLNFDGRLCDGFE